MRSEAWQRPTGRQLVENVVTSIAVVVGGGWAFWKWGYGEKLRKRREMCSPDGTLTATAVPLDSSRMMVTLAALWHNRGDLPIELCSQHSMVQVFAIDRSASLGSLKLVKGSTMSEFACVPAPWGYYIMEPKTESIMHEHFVVQKGTGYAFRWTICLSPGSIPGRLDKSHLVCTRELIWRTPTAADKAAV